MSSTSPLSFSSALAVTAGTLLALAGCSKAPAPTTNAAGDTLMPIALQTDWYPQGEHGGYYQALAKGFFAEAGMDVDILPGGPGAVAVQKVATGRVQFALGRSDDIIRAIDQGIPVVIVCALMQHDPQALLLHASNPISSFQELDGKTVMAAPGAVWFDYVQNQFGIKMNLIPLNFGLAQFMGDPAFIQQCFITNEPYFVEQQGKKAKAMLIASSGYDPYRVVFTNRKFAAEHPDIVKKFAAASVAGWDDYMNGDATPGNAIIQERNDQMNPEYLAYIIKALATNHLVAGYAEKGEKTGLITRARIADQLKLMEELKLLKTKITVDEVVAWDTLPQ